MLPPCAQLKQDDLWAKWMDVAFSKLDSNGDGFISLDEIVSTVPGSDDAADADNHLIAVSQARPEPSPHPLEFETIDRPWRLALWWRWGHLLSS